MLLIDIMRAYYDTCEKEAEDTGQLNSRQLRAHKKIIEAKRDFFLSVFVEYVEVHKFTDEKGEIRITGEKWFEQTGEGIRCAAEDYVTALGANASLENLKKCWPTLHKALEIMDKSVYNSVKHLQGELVVDD